MHSVKIVIAISHPDYWGFWERPPFGSKHLGSSCKLTLYHNLSLSKAVLNVGASHLSLASRTSLVSLVCELSIWEPCTGPCIWLRTQPTAHHSLMTSLLVVQAVSRRVVAEWLTVVVKCAGARTRVWHDYPATSITHYLSIKHATHIKLPVLGMMCCKRGTLLS
jgi:ABC-type uncharacterized transport system permease subunit